MLALGVGAQAEFASDVSTKLNTIFLAPVSQTRSRADIEARTGARRPAQIQYLHSLSNLLVHDSYNVRKAVESLCGRLSSRCALQAAPQKIC